MIGRRLAWLLIAPLASCASSKQTLGREIGPGSIPGDVLVPPVGGLLETAGVEEAEAAEGVRWVRVYRRPGHVFGELRRGADRAGAILALGASRDEALERARRAADAVRFRVDADAP